MDLSVFDLSRTSFVQLRTVLNLIIWNWICTVSFDFFAIFEFCLRICGNGSGLERRILGLVRMRPNGGKGIGNECASRWSSSIVGERERLECLGVAIYGPCFVIEAASSRKYLVGMIGECRWISHTFCIPYKRERKKNRPIFFPNFSRIEFKQALKSFPNKISNSRIEM